MILRQGLIAASLLAIVLPAYADPDDVTLNLTGVVATVSPDSDGTFAIGQPVSGSISFDFEKATYPPQPGGNPNSTIFTGIGNYSLTIGPDTMTSITPGALVFILSDGGSGHADQMTLWDMVPFDSKTPDQLIFDDLLMTLNDPDGTGFTYGSTSFNPSKFTVGTFDASGASFFSGGTVTGPIAVEGAAGRPVPEPPIALLLSTGMAGLIGWQALRRRAKAQLATTSLA